LRPIISVKTIINQNRIFLAFYLLFIITGGVLLLLTSKHDLHIALNQYHHNLLDPLFYYATYLGDGIMALLVFIIFLSVKYRYALLIGISNLFSAGVTQLLKHTVFDDVTRPKKFFEGIHDLYLVPGVDNYYFNSFPSGHTTCAFSLYFSLALITKNKSIELLLFFIAIMVGYSRVYLSQHFFEDIYAGSLVGVLFTIPVYCFIQQSNKAWLDKSVLHFFNK